jgi:6-phosphogluconolactonase
VSETTRRWFAADQVPASPEEKGLQMKIVSQRRRRTALIAKDAKREATRFLTLWRPGPVLLGLVAVAAAVVAVPLSASASTDVSPVVGHVYVDDNTAGANTIGAFDRHADGTLTPEVGSPFTAGGAGTGAGLASQGALQISADGRFLIAVDAASNQISVLRIKHDGSLKLMPHGVVSSGGVLPVSVAVHGDLVYVANAGTGGSNYTGFRLRPSGRLAPIAGSTVALPDGSQPGDVLFNGDGTKLAGTRVGTSQIDSFTVSSGGRLTAAPGSPFPAQGLGPFGSEFRPTNPDQLFVSNAHNVGPGTGTISAFSDSPNGTLSPIGTSPFADNQTAPCWVEITHDGQFLFTVNTGSGEISRYSIAPGGALTLLGSTPVGKTGGVGAVDARLGPDGGILWVDESRIGAVGAFAVSGGSLTELASSPTALPAGAAPAGIVVT